MLKFDRLQREQCLLVHAKQIQSRSQFAQVAHPEKNRLSLRSVPGQMKQSWFYSLSSVQLSSRNQGHSQFRKPPPGAVSSSLNFPQHPTEFSRMFSHALLGLPHYAIAMYYTKRRLVEQSPCLCFFDDSRCHHSTTAHRSAHGKKRGQTHHQSPWIVWPVHH